MKKEIEDLGKKIIEKHHPKTEEEFLDYVENEVENLPHIKEVTNKMILSRGTVIHLSINLERIFNKILILAGNESLVYSTFSKKASMIKNLTRKADGKINQVDEKFYKKIDRIIEIRNIFAHVPENVFLRELAFDYDKGYEKWRQDKTLKELILEFKEFNESLISQMDKIILLIRDYIRKSGPAD